MIRKIEVFEARDGARFDTYEKALERDRLCEEVAAFEESLGMRETPSDIGFSQYLPNVPSSPGHQCPPQKHVSPGHQCPGQGEVSPGHPGHPDPDTTGRLTRTPMSADTEREGEGRGTTTPQASSTPSTLQPSPHARVRESGTELEGGEYPVSRGDLRAFLVEHCYRGAESIRVEDSLVGVGALMTGFDRLEGALPRSTICDAIRAISEGHATAEDDPEGPFTLKWLAHQGDFARIHRLAGQYRKAQPLPDELAEGVELKAI